MNQIRKIHLIINPASGRPEPILNPLAELFARHGVSWTVDVTLERGDARRLARQAVDAGADIVAGYGGDGTIAEIANGLRGTGVPLGLLPGGTGNGLARTVGIPAELREAAALLCRSELTIRHIDAGEIDDRLFVVYAHTGLRPEQRATADIKSRVGPLAYMLHILRVMSDPRPTHYRLVVDDQPVDAKGIACVVANTVGLDLPLLPDIAVDDSRLNVLLVSQDLFSFTGDLLQLRIPNQLVRHWPAGSVTVETAEAQPVWIDGEAGGETPFTATICPGAVPLIVP